MTTKKSLLTATVAVTAAVAMAQPSILYKKAFGGTWYDYSSDIKSTPDSGMVIIGTTYSGDGDIAWNYNNSVDAFVIKLNAAGAVDWKRVYGGTGYDGGSTITPTSDGGYILGGTAQSNDWDVPATNTDDNLWIAKLNPQGQVQWKKTYGGSSFEGPSDIIQMADGSYVVGGTTRSNDGDVTNNHGLDDCWLLKLDTAGNLQWQKTYGGTGYEQLSKLIATNDGGFAFTALTSSNDGDVTGSHGGYDIWMVKTDVSGTIQWSRCYGGSAYEYSRGVIQTYTGDYVLLGQSPSHDGDGAFTDTTDIGGCWVVKTDISGNIIWENQYGGTIGESAASLTTDNAGNYIIAASSNSNDGNVTGHHGGLNKADYWIFCLDTAGTLAWQRSFGGTDDEQAREITRLPDGNLAVIGDTYSNSNGDVNGSGYHYGTETVNPPNSPAFTVNTGDFWMIKIGSPNTTGMNEQALVSMSIAPNPASESFTVQAEGAVTIHVSDLAGRIIYRDTFDNDMKRTVSVEGWAPGIYLVTVNTASGVAAQKLVIPGH